MGRGGRKTQTPRCKLGMSVPPLLEGTAWREQSWLALVSLICYHPISYINQLIYLLQTSANAKPGLCRRPEPPCVPQTQLSFPGGADTREQVLRGCLPLGQGNKAHGVISVMPQFLLCRCRQTQASQDDTQHPVPPIPEQLRVPVAETSSPECSQPPQRDGSTRPCNYQELPGRKNTNACKKSSFRGVHRT